MICGPSSRAARDAHDAVAACKFAAHLALMVEPVEAAAVDEGSAAVLYTALCYLNSRHTFGVHVRAADASSTSQYKNNQYSRLIKIIRVCGCHGGVW